MDQTATLEFSDQTLRIRNDDEVVSRESVSSSVTNGEFTTDILSWTDQSGVGSAIAWETGGYLKLTGTGATSGAAEQQITVAPADLGVQHALRIVVQRGPVTLRVGSTSGDDDYISATLGTGTHSLTLTPTGISYPLRQ